MAPAALLPQPIDFTNQYYSQGIAQKFNVVASSTKKANGRHAKIEFIPNKKEYQDRYARSLLDGGLATTLPEGWPSKVSGPMLWKGSDFVDESPFIYSLTAEDKKDIDNALKHFKEQDLHEDQAAKSNFLLPTLGPRLEKIAEDIYNGIGARVIRGLDVDLYSATEIAMIFVGISSYISEKRGVQDRQGQMIKHIIDHAKIESVHDLPLHTDVTCDVVATFTRACSLEGGMATIASSSHVYNELAATRPDILHTLAQHDWPFDTFGRDPAFYTRALLYPPTTTTPPILNFSRRILTGHMSEPRTPTIPHLTEPQALALDAVHYTASAAQMKLTMERGDMRFINNMGLLHGRDAFSDGAHAEGPAIGPGADGVSGRHLLRLWLHDEERCWALPPALRLAWARVFEDEERGRRWNVEPVRIPGQKFRGASPCD